MFKRHSDVETFVSSLTRTSSSGGWDASNSLPGAELYRAYEGWARQAGRIPVTLTAFGRTITRLGIEKFRTHTGVMYFVTLPPQPAAQTS